MKGLPQEQSYLCRIKTEAEPGRQIPGRKGQTMAKNIEGITEKLETGLKNLLDSENWKQYLKTLSRFHQYSFNNCILIKMQYPGSKPGRRLQDMAEHGAAGQEG